MLMANIDQSKTWRNKNAHHKMHRKINANECFVFAFD